MRSSENLSTGLETLLLDYIRVAGIFFVAGIALFNFTDFGKEFAIISLLIAFFLLIAILIEYFMERSRIRDLGFVTRTSIDILAYTMIALVIFIAWVVYQVWFTERTSLSDVVKEIEHEVDVTNAELIDNIRELDERIIAAIRGEDVGQNIKNVLDRNKTYTQSLKKNVNKKMTTPIIASLAAVS